jgi:hypothetical protein
VRHAAHLGIVSGLLALAGCGRPADGPPADTGSRAAVRAFFEAVGRRDWSVAYDALDPDSRARCSGEEFARRAEAYRQGLGLDPTGVRIPACEERGDDATAHVVLTGRGHGRREYRDAVTLRRRDGRWGVLPPAGIGLR